MNNKEFIEKIAPLAVDDMNMTGVLSSITIAQAILESNWGRSGLTVKANNLFGLKGSYKGQSVKMRTAEQRIDGTIYYIDAQFRKYPSWIESIADHSTLFTNGVSWNRNLYRPVIEANYYKDAAEQLQTCGYATDVNYARKLIAIIEQHNLSQYDKYPSSARLNEHHETYHHKLVAKFAPKPPQTITYKVVAGDNLTKIATKYGTTIEKLVNDNKIKDKNKIFVGQTLNIIF